MFAKSSLHGALCILMTVSLAQAQSIQKDDELDCEIASNASLEDCTGLSDTLTITNF